MESFVSQLRGQEGERLQAGFVIMYLLFLHSFLSSNFKRKMIFSTDPLKTTAGPVPNE